MINQLIQASDVGDVLERALGGERLTLEDGVRLFKSDDIHAIGAVANEVRRRNNGNSTFYVVNRHINYTDICKNRCKFCAYSREENDPDGYAMPVEEVVQRAEGFYDAMKFTELHIVGGCHPSLPFSYYTEMLRALKSRFPSVHIQAFTAVEIAHIAENAGLSVSDTLAQLKAAGLDSIPGGGAEVFSESVRAAICPEKLPGTAWLNVMAEAHRQGIKSNSTMLYGHVETYHDRVEHMLAIREVQDLTGGFMTFIPLKFHPANTELSHLASKPGSIDDLKVYAISRLMLDNIPHIKVFWIMLGLKLAQVALSYGADDFDGTVVEEKITHRAGAKTPEGLMVQELVRLIEETGTVAVERDTVYNEVMRDEAGLFTISQR